MWSSRISKPTLQVVTSPWLADLTEAFDLKIASGDVSISTGQCPKNGKLDIASGSVNVALPSQSAFGLSYDALSGRVDSDFPVQSGSPYVGPPNAKGSVTYGDPNAEVIGRFDVDMASGSLSLRKV